MSTALIVGDLQRGITENYGFARQVVPPVAELLPRVRAAGALVVHIHTAFRVNRADLPPGNALLRARGVDTVVLAGVATSAMVAATAYDAADRGYRVTVLADACADGDPAVHEFFLEKVFPSRGFEVTRCADWG
jgi:nicotinamidase-related amidase